MVLFTVKKNTVCGRSTNIPTYAKQENEWPILVFKAMFHNRLSLLFDPCQYNDNFKVVCFISNLIKYKNTTKKESRTCIRRFFKDCKRNGLANIFKSVGHTNVLLRFLKDQHFVTYVTNIFR